MKKIVGILGMAAVLASGAFAADPAANFVMTKFDGNASLDWIADLDAETTGLKHGGTASLAFGFVTAGDKATTGDGVWGEIEIKNDASDATTVPAASVSKANIHFIEGNFKAALSILKPSIKLGGFTPKAALPTIAKGTAGIGDEGDGDLTAGVALNMELVDYAKFNVVFMDNGQQTKDNKHFGLAMDTTVTAVDNLELKAGASFNFDKKYTGVGASANYTFAIPDSVLYVTPGVGYQMTKVGDAEAANELSAGVLFGWGAKDVEVELDYIAKAKQNEGISATVYTDLKEDGLALAVGLYDQSVLSLIGDNVGTLKSGLSFVMPAKKAAKELALGLNYDITVSVVAINVHGGVKATMPEGADATVDYKYGAKATFKVIDNTDLYAGYEGAKDKKGVITLGTNIHF